MGATNRDATYPAISDLKARACHRIPRFVWEYLDSATGDEAGARRNRAAFDNVTLMPSILHGEIEPDVSVNLLGQSYPLPFGIAPVGMSELIWPGAEHHLAKAAAQLGLPYSLYTVARKRLKMSLRLLVRMVGSSSIPHAMKRFAVICLRAPRPRGFTP